MSFVNIAAYKFVELNSVDLPRLQQELKDVAQKENVKGTILLSTEGINLMLAGERGAIGRYQDFLAQMPAFADLTYKESLSAEMPFSKLIVRIKKEIIRMNCDDIQPTVEKAQYVTPEQLKQWYQQGRDMVVIDTRNDYEVALGSFENAIDLKIESFGEFPQAIAELPEEMKQKPVVTFCTGGVRCEKAAVLMLKKGFKEVYQLEGGILNYFEQCGGKYFRGECFVFDNRVAVDPNLQKTDAHLCEFCGYPLKPAQNCHCDKSHEAIAK